MLAGGAALMVAAAPPGQSARASADESLRQLEMQLGGRVGLAALDTGTGARLSHRAAERFALCSTFKWLLAAAVLAKAEHGGDLLDRRLSYTAADLLGVSPVTRAHLAQGALSIQALCEAAVEVSDNTAANVLLRFMGGPQSLTHYLRRIGDPVTRLDRYEPGLNSNLRGDPRDTSTPEAMIATMQSLLIGNALSPASRQTLIGWLKDSRTGLHRLRAGLPRNWTVGDKTGTGANGAVNDSAIVWPPRRSPLLIAAYLSDSRAPADALEAAHADMGRIIAATFA
jgi:beta-lactamase class A